MSRRHLTAIVLMAIAALIAAACSTSGGGASASPSTAAATASPSTASVAPSASASPSAEESEEPSEEPSEDADATVEVAELRDFGPALVAGSNSMTVYIFTKDVKDNGKSACSGGCLATWPALTVGAGETPTGGSGVTGKLGTITRDDGTLQVTYNGLPLYFFKNDKAPGDAAGIYENWEAVKP
jgi:predicted lipoprotein with Yx(FWY)xxD motif